MSLRGLVKDSIIRNQLIAETASDWSWEYDFRTNQIYTAPEWRAFLGYREDEIGNETTEWAKLIHPEDIPSILEGIENQRRRNNSLFRVQYRVKTKSNHYKWVLSRGKSHYDENGQARYMVGYNIYFDPFKRIQDGECKFESLFNNISDAVFILSVDLEKPGRILEVNNNASLFTGYTREELLTKYINDIKPNEFQDRIVEVTQEVIKSKSYSFNSFILSKEKKVIPIEVNSRLIEMNGEQVHIAVVRDISERVKVQQDLRQSEVRSRKIVELAPIGAFIHDENTIMFVNNMGLELLGYNSEVEVIGRPLAAFVHRDYWGMVDTTIDLINNGKSVGPLELELVRADGTTIFTEIHTTLMKFRGESVALSYVKDITEQKRMFEEKQRILEKTLEYDRIKTEFFSNISHELRTPINIILSSIQLLNSIYGNKESEITRFFNIYDKYVGVMKQNSYRLLKLINNLIDLTRVDTGYLNMDMRNHNIVDVVEHIVMSVVPYLETKGISLIFDTDIEEKVMAFDEDKIERILLNLLSNAVKFTGVEGNIEVSIKDKENTIVLTIKDTGCGIPEDKLNIIFERFRQVDSLLTRRAEGSGIGLALVKSLVEAHGGTITAKSVVGEGSEFQIELPVRYVECDTASDISHQNINNNQNKIERINIEFSDIYT